MDCTTFDPKEYHGTVEGKIHHIVNSLNEDIEYMFMNWAQANVAIDGVDKPTIVYVLPPSGSLDFKWNAVKDYPQSQIAFICSTEFDFNGEENDNIIEAMKRLCIRFINAVNESGLFEPIEGNLPYQVMYDRLDQNVTGIIITPILKEVEGVSLCQEVKRID